MARDAWRTTADYDIPGTCYVYVCAQVAWLGEEESRLRADVGKLEAQADVEDAERARLEGEMDRAVAHAQRLQRHVRHPRNERAPLTKPQRLQRHVEAHGQNTLTNPIDEPHWWSALNERASDEPH